MKSFWESVSGILEVICEINVSISEGQKIQLKKIELKVQTDLLELKSLGFKVDYRVLEIP